jgi:CO/xanthine dehydrogenase Mo-binding subunit
MLSQSCRSSIGPWVPAMRMSTLRRCFLLSNFHDYRPMRINEAPIVETHVMQSSEPPGGVGEVPTATVSPAVANAVFAATGKRIRRLPIKALDAVP